MTCWWPSTCPRNRGRTCASGCRARAAGGCASTRDWAGYDPEFASIPSLDAEADPAPWDGMDHSILLGLGPYAAVILSQDD